METTQLKEEPGYNPCPTCVHHQGKKSIDDVSDMCFPCVWEHRQTGFWPNYQSASFSQSPAEEEVTEEEVEYWDQWQNKPENWQGYKTINIVKQDNVNSPKHYTTGGIETIDYIKAKLGHEGTINYCMGNVMKYTSRWQDKNGKEDLKKAQWYLNYAINMMEEPSAY
jgi:Protein of unknwon function (DUF3310)